MDALLAPDWANAALVTIDVQRDYLEPGGPLASGGLCSVLPGVGRLVREFRRSGLPIVHVVRFYLEAEEVDLPRRAAVEAGGPLLRPGTPGAELVDEAKPHPDLRMDADRLMNGGFQAIGPNEWIMYKPRWGAFYRTKLEHHLKDLGASTVVFCGASFPNGTRATVYQASERDFRIVLARDAVVGLYDRGEEELAQIGVSVLPSGEIADALAVPVA
jgi:nicotinamidase-related amidase